MIALRFLFPLWISFSFPFPSVGFLFRAVCVRRKSPSAMEIFDLFMFSRKASIGGSVWRKFPFRIRRRALGPEVDLPSERDNIYSEIQKVNFVLSTVPQRGGSRRFDRGATRFAGKGASGTARSQDDAVDCTQYSDGLEFRTFHGLGAAGGRLSRARSRRRGRRRLRARIAGFRLSLAGRAFRLLFARRASRHGLYGRKAR